MRQSLQSEWLVSDHTCWGVMSFCMSVLAAVAGFEAATGFEAAAAPADVPYAAPEAFGDKF